MPITTHENCKWNLQFSWVIVFYIFKIISGNIYLYYGRNVFQVSYNNRLKHRDVLLSLA